MYTKLPIYACLYILGRDVYGHELHSTKPHLCFSSIYNNNFNKYADKC